MPTNLHFLNSEARLHWARLEATFPGTFYAVVWEPLLGPGRSYLTPQAYEVLEQHVYEQVKAGLDLEHIFSAEQVQLETSQSLPLVAAEIEALIRLLNVREV